MWAGRITSYDDCSKPVYCRNRRTIHPNRGHSETKTKLGRNSEKLRRLVRMRLNPGFLGAYPLPLYHVNASQKATLPIRDESLRLRDSVVSSS
eukprot:2670475-Rhodomonas_salina.2